MLPGGIGQHAEAAERALVAGAHHGLVGGARAVLEPGPDDRVGHPEFAGPQTPVPMPEPVIERFSPPLYRQVPFEVFGAHWTPKSKPAICGDR